MTTNGKTPIIINSHGDEYYPVINPSPLAVNESIFSQRHRLGVALGQSFGGNRDLYGSLGYQLEPTIEHYIAFYRREIVARRLVNKPAQSTWQKHPIVKDDEESSEDKEPKSDFIKAFQDLVNRLRLWHYLERADKLAGIGSFGVLLIGVRDGKEMDQPLDGKILPEAILYLMPRSEQWVQIIEWNQEPQSPRYGLPEQYQITIGTMSGTGTQKVHHSRVIHIAENKTDDEVYGTPRLEAALNRLYDLDKVIGGSAEAFWLLVRKGLAILSEDGAFDDTTAGDDAFQEEIDKYLHGISRVMQLAGVKDIKDLGSEVVDPTGMFETLIALLAADADMPQAVLVGTQKNGLGGDASGETDQKMWAGTIEARQQNFAEPEILRPFIDWCLLYGVLPQPAADEYTVKWEPLYNPTGQDTAEVARINAEALKAFADARLKGSDEVMPPEVFTERYWDYVPETTPAEGLTKEDVLLKQAEEEALRQAQAAAQLAVVAGGNGNGNGNGNNLPPTA